MIEVSEKAGFYSCVATQRPAIWPIASGVAFVSRREHHDWGVALHIEGRALRPKQLREALERRFLDVERYSNYFLFLDVQRDFVVWHATPVESNSVMALDEIRRQELALVGLSHLDDDQRESSEMS